MEEFFLCRFLTGNELDIIDEENVSLTILFTKRCGTASLDCFYKIIGKLIALDANDAFVRILFGYTVCY